VQKQALAVPLTLPQCSTVRLDVRPPRFATCTRIEDDTCRFAANGVAPPDEVYAVFETNVFGVIAVMQAMLPFFVRRTVHEFNVFILLGVALSEKQSVNTKAIIAKSIVFQRYGERYGNFATRVTGSR